jgi:hypothetical protein
MSHTGAIDDNSHHSRNMPDLDGRNAKRNQSPLFVAHHDGYHVTELAKLTAPLVRRPHETRMMSLRAAPPLRMIPSSL